MGSAWLSGINLYATVLVLGLMQRFHLAQLPGDLQYLAHTWILIAAGALYSAQFIADKVPAVDSAWDIVHTFVRVPAGAVLAAASFAHFDPKVRLLALLLGGGIALSSHATKSATRLAANMSPGAFFKLGAQLTRRCHHVSRRRSGLLSSAHPGRNRTRCFFSVYRPVRLDLAIDA